MSNLLKGTILFHGSSVIVRFPKADYNLSEETTSDFGKGFYLTTSRQHSIQWAKTKGLRSGMSSCYVSEFILKKAILPAEGIKIFDGYDDDWLKYVMDCRMGRDNSEYGIVIGNVADARTYVLIRSYERNSVYEDKNRGEYINFRRLSSTEKKTELLRLISFQPSFLQICFRKQEFIEEYIDYNGNNSYSVSIRRR